MIHSMSFRMPSPFPNNPPAYLLATFFSTTGTAAAVAGVFPVCVTVVPLPLATAVFGFAAGDFFGPPPDAVFSFRRRSPPAWDDDRRPPPPVAPGCAEASARPALASSPPPPSPPLFDDGPAADVAFAFATALPAPAALPAAFPAALPAAFPAAFAVPFPAAGGLPLALGPPFRSRGATVLPVALPGWSTLLLLRLGLGEDLGDDSTGASMMPAAASESIACIDFFR